MRDNTSKRDIKLSRYAEIRSALDSLSDLAVGIGLDVANHQIYCDADAIPRALARLEQLARTLPGIERNLRICDGLTADRLETKPKTVRASSPVGMTSAAYPARSKPDGHCDGAQAWTPAALHRV